MKFLADTLLDFFGYIHRQWNSFLVFRDIQKRFIQRNRLDEVCIVVKDFMYLCRHAFVNLHPSLHENQLRTQFFRFL